VKDFEKAFDDFIPILPDLCCDIPRAAEYTGYFLAQGCIMEFLSVGYLTPEKLMNNSIGPHMAEGILAQYFKILKQKDLVLLKRAYLPFMDTIQNFVKDYNKDRFLQANDLLIVLGEIVNVKIQQKEDEPYDEPERELEPEQEPEPEPEQEPEPEPVPEPEPEPEQIPQPEPEPEPQREPEPEHDPQPEPESKPHTGPKKPFKNKRVNKKKGPIKRKPPRNH